MSIEREQEDRLTEMARDASARLAAATTDEERERVQWELTPYRYALTCLRRGARAMDFTEVSPGSDASEAALDGWEHGYNEARSVLGARWGF